MAGGVLVALSVVLLVGPPGRALVVPPIYEFALYRLDQGGPAGGMAIAGPFDVAADGMDQGADRCLARRDDPPPQRVRPAAQPGQDLLRQVSGLAADLPRRSGGGNPGPPSPSLALSRRHNVPVPVSLRKWLRRAQGRYHGMISISDAALMTCDVRTWQGISGVCRDASAGKLNEPLHGAHLQNSLNSPGSTV